MMPTFPVPLYKVPENLNPFNLKHCLIVAYWVYCCPTTLKYYLYRAAPELYRTSPGRSIFKTLAVRAYRNLYFCIPLTTALLSITLSLSTLLILRRTSICWSHWLLGLVTGNIIGIIFLIVFGVTFGLTVSTARGAAGGPIISLVAGVANASVISIVLGLSPAWSYMQLLSSDNLSVIALFSLAIGTPVAITVGGIIGGIVGIATGLASGLVAGVVFGIVETAVKQVEVSGLVYAAIIGLAASGAFGSSMTMASCLMFCLAVGVAVGISVDLALYQDHVPLEKGLVFGAISTCIVWMGVLRFIPLHISYLIYTIIYSLPGLKPTKHPIVWDELIILPLPGAQKYLEALIYQNEETGLALLAWIAKNPLQRSLVQRVFKKYMIQKDEFLKSLYRFLRNSLGDSYIFAPVDPSDWGILPTSREVLFGELISQWVDCTSEITSYRIERFIYGFTWLCRDHKRNLYTFFCEMLYDLSYGLKSDSDQFDLSRFSPIYSAFSNKPGGQEVTQSLIAIAEFLKYTRISQLSGAAKKLSNLPLAHEAIRPDVIEALNYLKRIASDISIAEDSNSLFMIQASLLRAHSNFEELRRYIRNEVSSPEHGLLQIIVEQWSHFVTEAGGEAGNLTRNTHLLKNPYIIGTPVIGDAFIGRDDILRRITDELLAVPVQCPSIVLYGHRRMGKSSILKNLGLRLQSTNIKVIDFNMQILGHVSSTNELLYALARQIYHSLNTSQLNRLKNLDRNEFIYQNPYHSLNDFFQSLELVLESQRFIIAVDEFEKIEEKIETHQLASNLIEFMRGLTQTYLWFSLIFAGLHNLEEMCYNYWHPFFTSIPIRVGFLAPNAAKQLILQADNVAYEDKIVSKIVQLTNGQPYLIQLICHTLITCFNRNLLDKKIDDHEYPVFNLGDLEKILNSSEFYTTGNAYFKGIWLQALNSQPDGQIKILKKLASNPMSIEKLVEETDLGYAETEIALQSLQNHDVIKRSFHEFTYAVELMRKWVVSHQL